MDSDALNPSCCKKASAEVQPPVPHVGSANEDEEELNALLSPQRGQMSKKQKNSRRKVQWNDRNGNKLVEILEFQPSFFSKSGQMMLSNAELVFTSVGFQLGKRGS